MARSGHGVSTVAIPTVGAVRRGAAFETWLRNRGYPGDVAEVWAGHAVWATGYAAGAWGKSLFEATAADLQVLADSGSIDWQEVGPAIAAWFDWLGADRVGAVNPAAQVLAAAERPRLRLVDGGR